MKYSCGLIRDLLPLYLDDVCSAESRQAVETHLRECPSCNAYYQAMRDPEEPGVDTADQELQKAASFRAVKKRLFRKQLLAVFGALTALLLLLSVGISVLKQAVDVVEYHENISVSMIDGNLVGRLQGSNYTSLRIKTITDETQHHYLFFCVSSSKWDALVSGSNVFSEFTLSYADKGASQVDAVYYYTGSYTDLEGMDVSQLQQLRSDCVCLWKK